MSTIADNLQAVRERIAAAAHTVSRPPHEISLLAVSKTFDAEAVRAAVQGGQRAFGENYLQEALDKMAALQNESIAWHFIGPIQSNKTRQIAEHFAWVHAVDREKIAQRLSEQRPAGMPPLHICLQVNVSGEVSKSGVAPADVAALAAAVAGLPKLKLRGLMAIPEPTDDVARQRAAFRQVRQLCDDLRAHGFDLDTLSMGMSGDLEAAIAEGATIVRVGTAIFGRRNDS
ncbi:MAG: YggS family pyridoxal phosphate-dependent enzyme [Proteobacteria bacterium]|nr:YggS family pyridoxal phosphate-dependent enzyme [Pseudomonadota bacterium]